MDPDKEKRVKATYQAKHYYTTAKPQFGYASKTNSDYFFGSSDWYSKDVYAPDYMDNRTTPADM
jgi:hypothetical protein